MSSHNSPGMLDALFRTDAMRQVFSDESRLQGMLDFEAALARSAAGAGVIPEAVVADIESQCRAEAFDMGALAIVAESAGNSAIPMAKALTAKVAARNREAARYVHWGATSQDAMDSGLMLQLRAALDLVDADLSALSEALASLAGRHKLTPAAGRTWLQQAAPIAFGLKVAGWLDAVERHRARMRDVRSRALALQFGGATGTLASLGDRGLDVAKRLATDLKLPLPDLPWHAHRDRVAEVATTLGLLTGTLGKIARDVSLSMQTEVGETFEPAGDGRGGSSTMPHKRNPVSSAVVLAAATRMPALVSVMLAAMVQEHERGLGNWHAEWETLPEIFTTVSGALRHAVQMIVGLAVDAARMRENLELTQGLVMAEAVSVALATKVGREEAHGIIEKACRAAVEQHKHLRGILGKDARVAAHLDAAELDRLFDPENYLGVSEQMIDAVLANRKP